MVRKMKIYVMILNGRRAIDLCRTCTVVSSSQRLLEKSEDALSDSQQVDRVIAV